jgi:dephospho-CoA kinase
MLKAALTGNYGMGKSLVMAEFGRLGAATFSADAIVAELLEDPDVLARVRGVLSDVVFLPDGSLNKPLTARIIFMDPGRRKAIEGILHPLVYRRIDELIATAPGEIAIVEVPLLFETGEAGRFDVTVAVYADYTTVLQRLKPRGITREDILLRHCAQMPIQQKIDRAELVIDNNGPIEHTAKQVSSVYAELLRRAEGNGSPRS